MKRYWIFILMIGLPFILGCGLFDTGPQPQDYVPNNPSDCFVPPRGDPVYDEFYSQNVNPNNCEAFRNQGEGHILDSQAQNLDAQTAKIQLETWINKVGAGATILIVVLFIGIGLFALTR